MLTRPVGSRGPRGGFAICVFAALIPAVAQNQAEARVSRNKSVKAAQVSVTAEKAFGLTLLRAMVDRQPASNVFISPLSIFLALQMAGDGAAGTTRQAILNALVVPPGDAQALDASTREMHAVLIGDEQYNLKIANALWADRRFTLAPDFLKLCESVFGAHAASLDLGDSSSARQINDWVSKNTAGKITDLVTPASLAKSAMLLTNAVYFKGEWSEPFPARGTEPAKFHKTSGDKTVSMMHDMRISGAYRSGPTFEGAMLKYKGSGVFLYALLPRTGKTPKDVLASIDAAHFASGSDRADLDLKLPRFTLDFAASLNHDLEKMGMGIAFRFPDADFSPMGSRKFFISQVIHKTRLEVDEKGTVAAAATAVYGAAGASRREPPPARPLVFNRPFVVLIGDAVTGALIFAGVVENP